MNPASGLALLLALAALGLWAQEAPETRYMPASRSFACDLPQGWQAFEEDPSGSVVHLLGPDNPSGSYRTGIDIRLLEGKRPYRDVLAELRRSDPETGRAATAVRPLRIPAALARTFEVVETRWLPEERLPALAEELHHYVALIPSGESLYLVRLSSSRDVYLEHRELFVRFLKSFKPL